MCRSPRGLVDAVERTKALGSDSYSYQLCLWIKVITS